MELILISQDLQLSDVISIKINYFVLMLVIAEPFLEDSKLELGKLYLFQLTINQILKKKLKESER